MANKTHPTLKYAAEYASEYRQTGPALQAAETAAKLRQRFCVPLPDLKRDGQEVIADLISAAEPGLVGNTEADFFAWVMGGSDPTGVAADWLTSVWGQNAAIFQTSPAAAIAEEAVSSWLLELLELPRESGVGFVTGATMAGFVGLAAARAEVLARVGHDVDQLGLQGAPLVHIYLSEDAHVSNFAALRFLGFGEVNLVRVDANRQGVMDLVDLEAKLASHGGPQIIIGQAGHINSGGFDDFTRLADLTKAHDGWLHVDGAFGLWARVLAEKDELTAGLELADSWSVDGHKWLQLPYDSGFAIVRNVDAMRRAMDMSASYLNQSAHDGRNPTQYNPELSRRARGFAAWAVMQSLGCQGIENLVREHCFMARDLAQKLDQLDGISVLNRVDLNQIIVQFAALSPGQTTGEATEQMTAALNAQGHGFLRTTEWQNERVMRISIIAQTTTQQSIAALHDHIVEVYAKLRLPAQVATRALETPALN
jgi:glutamate/tyrosine decarboxylase-like PLP-dependent enzyme